jgi:hypothetical protein
VHRHAPLTDTSPLCVACERPLIAFSPAALCLVGPYTVGQEAQVAWWVGHFICRDQNIVAALTQKVGGMQTPQLQWVVGL